MFYHYSEYAALQTNQNDQPTTVVMISSQSEKDGFAQGECDQTVSHVGRSEVVERSHSTTRFC